MISPSTQNEPAPPAKAQQFLPSQMVPAMWAIKRSGIGNVSTQIAH